MQVDKKELKLLELID